jgi:hypothetical protein
MQNLKKADLLSTAGAGILGAGIAIVFQDVLKSHATIILTLGIISHGGGMLLKHNLEKANRHKPHPWENILYWGCWLSIVLLLIYLIQTWMNS